MSHSHKQNQILIRNIASHLHRSAKAKKNGSKGNSPIAAKRNEAIDFRNFHRQINQFATVILTISKWVRAMHVAPGYILLLAKQTHQVRLLASSLGRSRYSVAITNSEEQAIAQTVQEPPFLIILAGDRHHWSQALLHELRCHANAYCITLIALTDFHAPYWVHQEENPGFDGFLVNPISSEVLSSLVQSAHTRQACYPAG